MMTMTRTLRRGAAIIALGCTTLQGAASAATLAITLPPETATYKSSELPGYKLVLQNCLQCHSAQYPQMQPATSPRAYWDATVRKMKKPFGAQFADEDIPAMVDYLVKTYGAEQPAAVAAAHPPQSR
jgi:cytochrome c5